MLGFLFDLSDDPHIFPDPLNIPPRASENNLSDRQQA
jgi:hypothetical protein